MTLKIPILTPPSTALRSSQNVYWKLGQITQGRVADSNRANPTVNIAGSNYQVTSNLQLAQGESLILKVSGVSPQVEFSIISRAERNVGNSDVASVILQDKFLHKPAITNRNMNTSLANLISLLHASSSSPVPPATALLIELMKSRLIHAGGLTNPKLIQNSLLGGSLLVGRPSDSKALGGGLLDLLRQITDSLESHQRSSAQRLSIGVKYQQALGMSLYLSSDVNFLRNFTRDVEEQYANLLSLRNKTQEDMQQHAYRLLAELPVLFKNHVESVSIRFFDKKPGGKKRPDGKDCGVDFEFELSSGKIYTRILIVDSLVYFFVGCERNSTVKHLLADRDSLERRLCTYGLKLKGLRISVHDGYLPIDLELPRIESQQEEGQMENIVLPASTAREEESTRTLLHAVYTEGKMPELEEFALRINNHDVEVTSEIPTHLYCAMACFFAQLYEAEKN